MMKKYIPAIIISVFAILTAAPAFATTQTLDPNYPTWYGDDVTTYFTAGQTIYFSCDNPIMTGFGHPHDPTTIAGGVILYNDNSGGDASPTQLNNGIYSFIANDSGGGDVNFMRIIDVNGVTSMCAPTSTALTATDVAPKIAPMNNTTSTISAAYSIQNEAVSLPLYLLKTYWQDLVYVAIFFALVGAIFGGLKFAGVL